MEARVLSQERETYLVGGSGSQQEGWVDVHHYDYGWREDEVATSH